MADTVPITHFYSWTLPPGLPPRWAQTHLELFLKRGNEGGVTGEESASDTVPCGESSTQSLTHKDPLIPSFRATARLLVTDCGVQPLILGHRLVRVDAKVEAAATALFAERLLLPADADADVKAAAEWGLF